MIHFLKGIVVVKNPSDIVVDVGNVGYSVNIPVDKYSSIPDVGGEIKVHTRLVLNQRDGSSELYGFVHPEEPALFDLLTSVPGIGPKTAHAIVCGANILKIQQAIACENHDYLTEFAGIGQKVARKIVLELKNKVTAPSLGDSLGDERDVLEALMALGYNKTEIKNAISKLSDVAMTTEVKVKEVLKLLG